MESFKQRQTAIKVRKPNTPNSIGYQYEIPTAKRKRKEIKSKTTINTPRNNNSIDKRDD